MAPTLPGTLGDPSRAVARAGDTPRTDIRTYGMVANTPRLGHGGVTGPHTGGADVPNALLRGNPPEPARPHPLLHGPRDQRLAARRRGRPVVPPLRREGELAPQRALPLVRLRQGP